MDLISSTSTLQPHVSLPMVFASAGDAGRERFFEFFAANIRNPNTRAAYLHAALRFGRWSEQFKLELVEVKPLHVAAYVEQLCLELAAPSVKQHLAAIRQLLDYLVTGHLIPFNPAASVRGPKYVIKKGKTPVLIAEEARTLFDNIDTTSISGLRDRALLGVMVYSFARIGAVLGMNVEDYLHEGRRATLRLHENGAVRCFTY